MALNTFLSFYAQKSSNTNIQHTVFEILKVL